MYSPLPTSLIVVYAFALVGCDGSSSAPPPAPALLAIQEAKIGVGQSMTFVGAGFFPNEDSRTEIRFDGEFTSREGDVEAVHGLRIRPHRQDANTLVWTNFGPFVNPFSAAGDRIGTFTGTATAITGAKDGAPIVEEVPSRPLLVELTIEPSIVIKSLQPKDNASCAAPVKRMLGSFRYLMTVEAVGFTPQNFTFTIWGEPGVAQPRVYRLPVASGASSVTFGADPLMFFFEPVPLDLAFYIASVDITALDTDGQPHAVRYTFGVHNPLEYITTGPAAVAEI